MITDYARQQQRVNRWRIHCATQEVWLVMFTSFYRAQNHCLRRSNRIKRLPLSWQISVEILIRTLTLCHVCLPRETDRQTGGRARCACWRAAGWEKSAKRTLRKLLATGPPHHLLLRQGSVQSSSVGWTVRAFTACDVVQQRQPMWQR